MTRWTYQKSPNPRTLGAWIEPWLLPPRDPCNEADFKKLWNGNLYLTRHPTKQELSQRSTNWHNWQHSNICKRWVCFWSQIPWRETKGKITTNTYQSTDFVRGSSRLLGPTLDRTESWPPLSDSIWHKALENEKLKNYTNYIKYKSDNIQFPLKSKDKRVQSARNYM